MKELHYFISLERELENSFNFVEPEPKNLTCYSAKFAMLLNTTCVEFESACKTLIRVFRPDEKVRNISDIKRNLLELFPNLCTNEVEIPRTQELRKPFLDWDNGRKLEWWGDYVDVKHNRIINFSKATLNNVLEAMSALVIILIYISRFRDNFFHIRSSGLFLHKSMGDDLMFKGGELPDGRPET